MTQAQKQPYVRFFASDWLAGTRGMRAVEVGVYITLIALMYERCEPLPEDNRRLARQCGCSPRSFTTILEDLIEDGKIIRTAAGLWNKRVEKEFKWRDKNSAAAKTAASERWKKANKNNSPTVRTQCERSADGMPNQNPEARSHKDDSSRCSESSVSVHGGFEWFWVCYPKRDGPNPRKPARQKFDLAVKNGARPDDIVRGAERYAERCRKAGKEGTEYVAQAVTWLNQERWRDEAEESRAEAENRDRIERLRAIASHSSGEEFDRAYRELQKLGAV